MSHTLKVQELINILKLHPENETAKNFLEDLEKCQVSHAKNQERFDLDFFIRIWDKDIKLNNESGEISIRKKMSSETDVVAYVEDVLKNTDFDCKNEKAKETLAKIISEIKSKVYNAKIRLEDRNESQVVIGIEDGNVDFSLAVYRTGNVISFVQSSLGKLDFSK